MSAHAPRQAGALGIRPGSPAAAVILCDAAAATGLGHFVRCSALARALSDNAWTVRLLLNEDALPAAVTAATNAGWQVSAGPWRVDAVVPLAGPGAVIVVDSYRVDGPWMTRLHDLLSARGAKLGVIDDDALRTFTADLVVNQNVGAERLRYPGAGSILSGPSYALLRPQFAQSRQLALQRLDDIPDTPRRVLVLFGGTDATGMAMTGAHAARLAYPDADVRVVVPSGQAPTTEEHPGITLMGHVEAIHEEMLAADLVISAGGSTLWELCCLARAAAVLAVADNQLLAYDELSRLGAILPLGRKPLRDVRVLAERLRMSTARPDALRAVATTAAGLTDGRGAERVAEALSEIPPRPAVAPEETM